MDRCPFCAGSVTRDLLAFGGRCPKCLGEIPGEEAATDPGEAVKRAQGQRDKATVRRRRLVPLLVAIPLVLGLGVLATYLVLRPEPQIALLDFDTLDFPMPDLVGRPAVPQPVPLDAVAQAGMPGGRTGQTGPTVDQATVARVVVPPSTVAGTGGDAASDEAGLDLGLTISARRRSEIYTDPDQITAMIGTLMTAQVPRLTACYEQRLPLDESLQGRWRIKYTVLPTGLVTEASAEGLGRKDPEFEACLSKALGIWQFDRIAREQKVQRTLTFRQ